MYKEEGGGNKSERRSGPVALTGVIGFRPASVVWRRSGFLIGTRLSALCFFFRLLLSAPKTKKNRFDSRPNDTLHYTTVYYNAECTATISCCKLLLPVFIFSVSIIFFFFFGYSINNPHTAGTHETRQFVRGTLASRACGRYDDKYRRGSSNDYFNRAADTDGVVCRKNQAKQKNTSRVRHGNRDRLSEWLNAVTVFVSSENNVHTVYLVHI